MGLNEISLVQRLDLKGGMYRRLGQPALPAANAPGHDDGARLREGARCVPFRYFLMPRRFTTVA